MVNPARDIGVGLTLGLLAAGAWNAYKKDMLRKTDAFYKQYDQQHEKIAVRKASESKTTKNQTRGDNTEGH